MRLSLKERKSRRKRQRQRGKERKEARAEARHQGSVNWSLHSKIRQVMPPNHQESTVAQLPSRDREAEVNWPLTKGYDSVCPWRQKPVVANSILTRT